MNSNRVLVTGANGRLGQAVLRMLGHNAIPAMRRPIAAKDGLLIEADGSVEREALRGFSAIINCAGRTQGASADINQANVTYPLGLAQIARSAGVRRFVHVSSFSVFGRAECIDTITPIAPRTAYGRSKVAAEHALRTLVADDFEVVSLRLPFMFSAQHPALLGRLISILLRSRVLPTQSVSSSRRSMIN
jgi:UDP-glucose 4-epimerase